MLKKVFTIVIVFCLFCPIVTYAKEISYKDAKVVFRIDENEWSVDEFNEDRSFIDKKWTSDCGMIVTGSNDMYGLFTDEELEGLTRKDINYKNLFTSNEFAESMLDEWKKTYNITNWEYKNYKMKFIYANGTITQSGVNMDYDIYITVNNGYMLTFQYMKVQGVNNGTCTNSIDQIVASTNLSIPVKEVNENMVDYNYGFILIDLALTIIAYMLYPFIRTKLMHVEYDKKSCKKMAMWNSIIVGGLFMIVTLSLQENGTWNAAPAFLYYWINKSIWVSKNKKNRNDNVDNGLVHSKDEDIQEDEETFTCDNCGALVKESDKYCKNCNAVFEDDSDEEKIDDYEVEEMFKCDNCEALVKEADTKCPKCGETFDDEDAEETVTKEKDDMDKKYSDLTKLKKLLDKEIISKEEFEKEKKKILNRK